MVELYQEARREKELYGEILAFSVSYDDADQELHNCYQEYQDSTWNKLYLPITLNNNYYTSLPLRQQVDDILDNKEGPASRTVAT